MSTIGLIVVNFGGPRTLVEVRPFLESLLTDEDVIRTSLPAWIQRVFFQIVARKRAKKMIKEYASIGGGSPIFEDTEWVGGTLSKEVRVPVLCFHRYLESTHTTFLERLEEIAVKKWVVFPLFPQFSYVTTGSVARWFARHIKQKILSTMKWIPSYATHFAYIEAFSSLIQKVIQEKELQAATLLFSAHGLPISYIEEGDPYEKECKMSFASLTAKFPSHPSLLAYQSQFGKERWLEPKTVAICQTPHSFLDPARPVLFIPLSFSSDHIETLFEVEQYCKQLELVGLAAYRCPALGRDPKWLFAIQEIIATSMLVENHSLIRNF